MAGDEVLTLTVDEDGNLVCPHCGGTEIQEDGTVSCWWPFVEAQADTKTLVLTGWEWAESDGDGFSCSTCYKTVTLPEGWTTDYV